MFMPDATADLLRLQISLFLMITVGFFAAKSGLIDKAGRKILSDLSFKILLPCNILKSYLGEIDMEVLHSCLFLLLLAVAMELFCMLLNCFLYNQQSPEHKRLMQYMTVCSNSGFLGAGITQGLYGDLGLLYNSVYMIPMRIFMWTVGMSYFTKKITGRDLIRNVFLHPCLLSLYLGLFLMLTQHTLPYALSHVVNSFGNCMVPIAMLVTGTILADMRLKELINRSTFLISAIRLLILPAITLLCAHLLPLDTTARGVAVLLSGMPAATVTVLFATQYDGDAAFATKCVVLTTLLSVVTIPVWSLVMLTIG